MQNSKYKNDILLILGILFITLVLFAVFKFNLKDGKYVNVLVDSKPVISYNLNDNVNTNIAKYGNKNILVIENGKAYIKDADCPDKICVSHRKISKVGETIICLPHKVVIEITGEKQK